MKNRDEIYSAWLAEKLRAAGRGSGALLAKHLGLSADKITRMTKRYGKESRKITASELAAIEDFFGERAPDYRTPEHQRVYEGLPEELQKLADEHLEFLAERAKKLSVPPDPQD